MIVDNTSAARPILPPAEKIVPDKGPPPKP